MIFKPERLSIACAIVLLAAGSAIRLIFHQSTLWSELLLRLAAAGLAVAVFVAGKTLGGAIPTRFRSDPAVCSTTLYLLGIALLLLDQLLPGSTQRCLPGVPFALSVAPMLYTQRGSGFRGLLKSFCVPGPAIFLLCATGNIESLLVMAAISIGLLAKASFDDWWDEAMCTWLLLILVETVILVWGFVFDGFNSLANTLLKCFDLIVQRIELFFQSGALSPRELLLPAALALVCLMMCILLFRIKDRRGLPAYWRFCLSLSVVTLYIVSLSQNLLFSHTQMPPLLGADLLENTAVMLLLLITCCSIEEDTYPELPFQNPVVPETVFVSIHTFPIPSLLWSLHFHLRTQDGGGFSQSELEQAFDGESAITLIELRGNSREVLREVSKYVFQTTGNTLVQVEMGNNVSAQDLKKLSLILCDATPYSHSTPEMKLLPRDDFSRNQISIRIATA